MFADYWSAMGRMKRLYQQELDVVCEKYEITKMELDVLLFLANNPQYDTAVDMIERRRLTKSHVSVSIAALEKRGFLERFYHADNKKTAHIRLLPASREIVEAGKRKQNHYFDLVLQGFTEEDRRALGEMFSRIARNAGTALNAAPWKEES